MFDVTLCYLIQNNLFLLRTYVISWFVLVRIQVWFQYVYFCVSMYVCMYKSILIYMLDGERTKNTALYTEVKRRSSCTAQLLLVFFLFEFFNWVWSLRSFEPILRLLPQSISPVSQHWATWALYNLVSVYREYLLLWRASNHLEVFWTLISGTLQDWCWRLHLQLADITCSS